MRKTMKKQNKGGGEQNENNNKSNFTYLPSPIYLVCLATQRFGVGNLPFHRGRHGYWDGVWRE